MKIVTIIPAYNEAETIQQVVKECSKYSDVIVISDGSTDNTSKIARNTGARVCEHEINQGKGSAIKTGLRLILEEDYQIIILLDGDGQHDPHHIPHLAKTITKKEMVIGSRFKNCADQTMPLQRKISNNITTRILRYITGYNLSDSQCGFRAFSADIAPLFLDIPYDDYIFESEMLYLASKNHITVKEIPVPCTYGVEKSYIKIRDIIRYLIYILTLLIRNMMGRG